MENYFALRLREDDIRAISSIGLAHLKDVRPVKRDIAVEPEEENGAGHDDQRQDAEGPPVVAALRRGGLAGALRGRRHVADQQTEKQGGHDQRQQGKDQRAVQSEQLGGRRDQQRAGHKAAVAAHGKDTEPRALPTGGNAVGVARAFRMKERAADAAQNKGGKNGRIAVQQAA